MSYPDYVRGVLREVDEEMDRSTEKHGDQRHLPLGGSVGFTQAATVRRAITDRKTEKGTVTWADILYEEVMEALAEEDPIAMRAELVQVSSVAAKMVEVIDYQGRRNT